MCLYPRLVQNPKYKPNKKNGGHPPRPSDPRVMAVPIKCGKCIECREAMAREWKIRLNEELKNKQQAWYITLTFSEEALMKCNEYATQKNQGIIADENTTASSAVRLFLERWRKKYKKSLIHWLITELGHSGTERLHLHGIVFTDTEKITNLENIWQYGWVDIGKYCNSESIGYITKYITKIDNDHKDFTGKIFCSAGIGDRYIKSGEGKRFNAYRGENTKEYYKSREGYKMQLPIYYRNNIYTEEEREKLWLFKLDKKERYIRGIKYKTETIEEIKTFMNALKTAQKDNIKNRYGSIKWIEKDYNKQLEQIKKWKQ